MLFGVELGWVEETAYPGYDAIALRSWDELEWQREDVCNDSQEDNGNIDHLRLEVENLLQHR